MQIEGEQADHSKSVKFITDKFDEYEKEREEKKKNSYMKLNNCKIIK